MIEFQSGNADHVQKLRRHVEAYQAHVERRILMRIVLVVAVSALAAVLYYVLTLS